MRTRTRMRRCTRTFRLSPSPPGKHALALAVQPLATPPLVRATVREHRSPATRLPPPHGASNGGALLPRAAKAFQCMLGAEIADVRRAERRLRQREYVHGRRRRVGISRCATAWCTDVALAIAALDDFKPDLAVRWLLLPVRRGAPLRRGATEAEVRRHVEDRLLAEDAAALSAMPTPGVGRLNLHGTRVAHAFVAEARLASWVSEQNRSAGLPVRSSAACSRFEELLSESAPAPEHPQLNAETEPPPHLVGAEYNARRRTASQHWERNFVRRWRFRCGSVRYRSMRPRDPLSLEEKQEKATRKCVSVYSS